MNTPNHLTTQTEAGQNAILEAVRAAGQAPPSDGDTVLDGLELKIARTNADPVNGWKFWLDSEGQVDSRYYTFGRGEDIKFSARRGLIILGFLATLVGLPVADKHAGDRPVTDRQPASQHIVGQGN